MTTVGYNPAARFDVEMTDRVYLEQPERRRPGGNHHTSPREKGPSRVCSTFTAADGP